MTGRSSAPLAQGALTEAAATASELLAGDPQRWRHTCTVVAQAQRAAVVVPPRHARALVSAAWLHDIGYAPQLHDTGFHPLDGARYLRRLGWPPVVAGLVAHHSAAALVADVLGLSAELGDFDGPGHSSGLLAAALTWADQTSGPSGEVVDVHRRLEEAAVRHGPHTAQGRARPHRAREIVRAVGAVEAALARHLA